MLLPAPGAGGRRELGVPTEHSTHALRAAGVQGVSLGVLSGSHLAGDFNSFRTRTRLGAGGWFSPPKLGAVMKPRWQRCHSLPRADGTHCPIPGTSPTQAS